MKNLSEYVKRLRTAVAMSLSAFALAILPAFAFCGCSDAGEDETVRPQFAKAPIEVEVGQTVVTHILNATEVKPQLVPRIVEVEINGTEVAITGVEAGEQTLRLQADGYTVQCTVKVLLKNLNPDNNETPEETARQLADDVLRVSCRAAEIRYDRAGAMFIASDGGLGLQAIDMAAGTEIVVGFANSLPWRATDEADAGRRDVSDAAVVSALTINGSKVAIKGSELLKSDGQGSWFRVTTERQGNVWICVPHRF